jgi:uncharacterized protein (DUF885 family)
MRLAHFLAFAAVPLSPLAVACCAPAAAQDAAAAPSQSGRIHAWFEAKYEEMLQFSPLELSQQGRKDRYGELDEFSIEAQDEQLAWQKATVDELERSFDYATLSPAEQLSYDLWKFGYERNAEAARWRGNDYIFTQMQGMHTTLPTLMVTMHRVDAEQDMVDYISRVGQFERALGQLVDRAQANAERGVRPPYFAYDTVIAESRGLIDGAPFTAGTDSALWQDGKAKIAALVAAGKIDEARAGRLRTDLSAALTGPYIRGYQRLIAFMEADRANAGTVATGAGSLPDGQAYYASQLKAFTTTDLAPEEVHRIGLEEVARIRGEMEAIKTAVGFTGDLPAFFEHIKNAEWNSYPNTDTGRQAYLADSTAALDNVERELPNYFGLLPKAALEVRRVEPFREQDGAAQHYQSGTPDGSRPGVYYVHLSDTTAMPKNQLEVIAYHEGLPGHHMQISIAQELEGVPTFQTQFGLSAYSEGWGLYAEKLAKEMPNTYTDPYADFGRLSSEIFRAIRLVVDTGLHSKGWTEEEAIAYFVQNSPEPLDAIRSEVRRYIVWPGQATSYKIGMLKIEGLRAEAERELGAAFDIRGFHDVILGSGAMPLSLLERRVRAWIAERKAA